MPYARPARGPLLFKSFTGLAVPEFDVIAKEIESKYVEHETKRLSNRKRESEVGAAGRPFPSELVTFESNSFFVSAPTEKWTIKQI